MPWLQWHNPKSDTPKMPCTAPAVRETLISMAACVRDLWEISWTDTCSIWKQFMLTSGIKWSETIILLMHTVRCTYGFLEGKHHHPLIQIITANLLVTLCMLKECIRLDVHAGRRQVLLLLLDYAQCMWYKSFCYCFMIRFRYSLTLFPEQIVLLM